VRHATYGWRALACQVIALSMVTLGLVVAAPPAHAVADAVVSGTVVDSLTKQPLADVTVSDSTSGRSTTTPVAGTYSLSVPAGDHVLTATLAGYVPSSSPKLTLTSGQVLATQGFTLEKYASASGLVTEKGTTNGIAAVVVKLFDAASTDPNPEFAATTGPDGSWSLDQLAPGTYKVQFDGASTDFLDRWYPAKPSRDTASDVTLTAGEAKTISDALARRPSLHGRVLGNAGEVINGATTVTAKSTSGDVKTVLTDGDGYFTIAGLAEASYQLMFTHSGYVTRWYQSWDPDAYPVALLPGAAVELSTTYLPVGSTVNGTVHLAPGQTALVMSGWVRTTTATDGTFSLRDVDGDVSVTVRVYALGYEPFSQDYQVPRGQTVSVDIVPVVSAQPPATAAGKVTGTDGSPIVGATVTDERKLTSATTRPDGSFAIPRVDPTTLQFRVSASGYVPRTVSAVTATLIGTVVLQRSATVSGSVLLGRNGTPAVGAYVNVSGSFVRTDSDGRYTATDVSPGYYKVSASATVDSLVLTTYLGGAISEALATYTVIPEGAVLTGRDITIAEPATLSGVVRALNGAPVQGQPVALIGMGSRVPDVRTGADGSFILRGILPGTYRLCSGWSDDLTWWNDTGDVGKAGEIQISSGAALTGYALTPLTRYSLSGTLRSSSGKPLSSRVQATNGSQEWTTYSDATGVFRFTVPEGRYELGAVDANYATVWSPGALSPDLFTVSSNVVKDLTLPDTRTVVVKLSGSDGGVPWGTVSAYNAHEQSVAGGYTLNGSATLSLTEGTYRVTVSALRYLAWSTQLTVTSSGDLSVRLDAGGRISGGLWDSVAVTAINVASGERFTNDDSSRRGPYTLSALPAGDYVVTATPFNSYTACGPARWWGGSSYLTARRLHLDSGTTLTGIDFTFTCEQFWTNGGDVLGDVAMPPGVAPVDIASTRVYATNSVRSVSTVANADGTFELVLPSGTYQITAYQTALGLEGHATVTVETGVPMVLTLTMTKKGLVTGHVVGPLGDPLDALVSTGEQQVQTDALGEFRIGGLTYGTHTLTVRSHWASFALTFFDVTVGPGSDALGVTIRTRLAATMSGRVSTTAGSVEVTLVDETGRVVESEYVTGSYSFPSVPPGPTKVRFSGTGIVTEWWRDAADLASATPVQLPEGGGVTDVTPNLRPAAAGEGLTTVTGKVTYASSPLGGVTVSTQLGSNKTTTDSQGSYRLVVPRGDTYSVKAEICLGPSTPTCSGQYYAEARDVIADQASVTGVDFAVPLPASAFTTAYQPVITGRPISGQTLTATMGAWSPTPDSTTWQWYADGLAIYNATGKTLTLTDKEVGTEVQVVVTQAKAGYSTITLPSEPVLVEVPGAIHALTPSRLLDSRIGQGFQGPATNGTVMKLPVWGKGGVPAGASAVLVNITVTQPTTSGFLTAYASGGAAPWVSNANFTAGTTCANLSLVPVGADGAIALKTTLAGSMHVVADVQGYIVGGEATAAGAVVPVTPTRVLDTRATGHVGPWGTVTLSVTQGVGVPVDATAVFANLTVTGPQVSGFLTAWPASVTRPTASNVNFVANQTVPNLAIVKVGANGSISIFNSTSKALDVVVDIQGYVTAGTPTLPGTVLPVTPTRALDTRSNLGAEGPVPASTSRTVDLDSPDLPSLPQGALINLTVADPATAGWLAAYPAGVARPLVSNLNFTAGAVVPNMSLATLSDGYVELFNGSSGNVQMVADVLAYVLS
jgi:hypothetical protein